MLTKSLQQGKQTNEQTKKLLFRWVEIKTSQQNIQKQYSLLVGMDDELQTVFTVFHHMINHRQ